MAFDWTKIEGYRDDLTSDEKLALLENWKPDNDPEPSHTPDTPLGKNMVSKTQFDKVASELAAAKKQLRARMSEDEQREADRAAKDAERDAELQQLRREKTLSTYKASYLAQGYDEKLAEEAATAMVDGETDVVFSAMKKHAANVEKELRARILKETPVPPPGNEPDDKKKDRMAKLRKDFGL